MAEVRFSTRAYSKIILHAAKYPHCAINGLLLAEQKPRDASRSKELYIVDVVPLFHLCLHVSPMAEVALTMVDQVAAHQGLLIAGYYLANENISDLSVDKPAHRIADKIAESYASALLVVVDNRKVTLRMDENPLRVSLNVDGKWKPIEKNKVNLDKGVLDGVSTMLQGQDYRDLVDFDNHLDNISLDWQNNELNKIIDEAIQAVGFGS
ncbi:ER membrane protein complex subunit 8/9 homolog [Diprion similis]|uniref:ER membrane protein complex subunit 8/9 homolog n=1 Tax=Diprion similis TaxID=362088 RepID=UPI001EF8156D|nr:ER membrane protein complex subunit 8/9 homolog [Diprion similis]